MATKTTTKKTKKVKPATPKAKLSRKTLKKGFRAKLAQKIKTEVEFAKAYFEGKSKRAIEKKAAFKKKKKGKK